MSAQLAETEIDQDNQDQYLTFIVQGNVFGVDILGIKEIIEFCSLTQVPLVPDYIRGVLNLRGRVIPVVDLNVRFGLEKTETTKKTCIVVVEVHCEDGVIEMGMLIDEVLEVKEILEDQLEKAPDFGANIRTDFIRGMARQDQGFIVLLELDKVVSVSELTVIGGLVEKQEPGSE
mgnify:CR=1 FL=1